VDGEIYARIAQMREAAATIQRSATRIDGSLNAVDREIRALGTDRFMSLGAEAFRAEYNRLTPRLRDAFDLLTRFHQQLATSADDIEIAARAADRG
jgi:WXG100 family type VII secretion target